MDDYEYKRLTPGEKARYMLLSIRTKTPLPNAVRLRRRIRFSGQLADDVRPDLNQLKRKIGDD